MKKIISSYMLIMLYVYQLSAQTIGRSDTLDVLHYDIHLGITDFLNKSISGNTIITITPLMNSISVINLDLLALNVDSIYIDDVKNTNYSYNDTLIRITLSNPINISDTIKTNIYYHGNPVKDPSDWGGFYFSGNYAFNLGVGFEAVPHNFGRVWFPCIDEFKDRAMYDCYITTLNSHIAVCGGSLIDVTQTSDTTKTHHWKLQQSIPTYLASVAVGDYVKVIIPSTIPNVPIEFYSTPSSQNQVVPSLANIDTIAKIFISRFGPFLWDRIGYVGVSFNSGAMEHATNIAYPTYALSGDATYEDLYAHELSHHWFGDLITCEKAEEMWINEGFARYSEAIFKEILYPNSDPIIDGYKNEIRELQHKVLKSAHRDDGDYYAIANVDMAVTYGTTSYDKGALVIHTLRRYMGDDKFFSSIKHVLYEYKFKPISSEQFRDAMSSYSGINLNDFFDAWVFQPGFLHFSVDSLILENSSTNQYRYTIKQQLHKALNFGNSNKAEVQFFGANWQKYTDTIRFSGEFGTKSIQLPFTPVYYTVDFDENMADAISDYNLVLKTVQNNSLPNAFVSVNVTQITDSALIRVEHHWVSPNSSDLPSPSINRLSPNRYWRIDGIIPTNFDAKIVFNYNSASDLDLDFINSTSQDSICMAYRRDIHDTWKLVPFTKFGAGTGIIRVDHFLPGEYALAVGDIAQIGIEQNESLNLISIYPNPTSSSVFINNANQNNLKYSIFDSLGKRCRNGKLEKGLTQIDLQDLPKGVYSVEIISEKGLFIKEKVIKQ